MIGNGFEFASLQNNDCFEMGGFLKCSTPYYSHCFVNWQIQSHKGSNKGFKRNETESCLSVWSIPCWNRIGLNDAGKTS